MLYASHVPYIIVLNTRANCWNFDHQDIPANRTTWVDLGLCASFVRLCLSMPSTASDGQSSEFCIACILDSILSWQRGYIRRRRCTEEHCTTILRIACINIQNTLVCQINLFGLLICLLRNDLACLSSISSVRQPSEERQIERALH
jgi:hypothetical protein